MTQSPNRPPLTSRIAGKLHLLLGVTVGFYILLMSISGTSLVFADQILGILEPKCEVPASGSGQMSLTKAVQNTQSKYKGHEIKHLHIPVVKTSPLEIYLYKGNDRLVELVNPYSAEPIGARNTFIQWIMNLHFDLLNGSFGRNLNGVGALFLFTILISGLTIWWQGVSRVKQRLSIDFKANWRRINWDIHTALSIWAVPFVLVWATSGFYFGYPDLFKKGLSLVLPSDPSIHSRAAHVELPVLKEESNIDRLVLQVEESFSGLKAQWVKFDPENGQVVRVRLGEIGNSQKDKLTVVNIDPQSHTIKSVIGPEDKQNSQKFIDLIKKLHFGTLFGLYTKSLWVVLGLMPALLFCTGFMIWFNKFRASKKNKERASKP